MMMESAIVSTTLKHSLRDAVRELATYLQDNADEIETPEDIRDIANGFKQLADSVHATVDHRMYRIVLLMHNGKFDIAEGRFTKTQAQAFLASWEHEHATAFAIRAFDKLELRRLKKVQKIVSDVSAAEDAEFEKV